MLENGPELYLEFNSLIFNELLYDRGHFEWQVDIAGYSVGHYLEKTIWWNECDGPISIKPSQSHTLMKFNIINLNSLLLLLSILRRGAS